MEIRTIRCCLCVNESTRKSVWQATVTHVLLVNALLRGVAEHPAFPEWQRKGAIPRQALEQMIAFYAAKLNAQEEFGRFRTSAILITQYVYKSWFACRKQAQ